MGKKKDEDAGPPWNCKHPVCPKKNIDGAAETCPLCGTAKPGEDDTPPPSPRELSKAWSEEETGVKFYMVPGSEKIGQNGSVCRRGARGEGAARYPRRARRRTHPRWVPRRRRCPGSAS